MTSAHMDDINGHRMEENLSRSAKLRDAPLHDVPQHLQLFPQLCRNLRILSRFPITPSCKERDLTLAVKAIGISFRGVLNVVGMYVPWRS